MVLFNTQFIRSQFPLKFSYLAWIELFKLSLLQWRLCIGLLLSFNKKREWVIEIFYDSVPFLIFWWELIVS